MGQFCNISAQPGPSQTQPSGFSTVEPVALIPKLPRLWLPAVLPDSGGLFLMGRWQPALQRDSGNRIRGIGGSQAGSFLSLLKCLPQPW